MGSPLGAFIQSVPVYGASAVSPGMPLVQDTSGFYLPASVANRAAYGRTKAIALSYYGAPTNGQVSIQNVGTVDSTLVNVAPGAADRWVRINASLGFEVFTPVNAGTSDIVGKADVNGVVTLQPGVWTETMAVGVGVASGACTLEAFGAKGDGITDDSAAWDAASNAIRAGTYGSLLLGSRTYFVNPTTVWPYGGSIRGNGNASVLKTTQNRSPVQVYDTVASNRSKSTTFVDFMILGSIGTNPSYTSQGGVEVGVFGNDGSSRITVVNVIAKQCAGVGFTAYAGDDYAFGPAFIGCTADGCWKGFVGAYPGEAVGCRAVGCTAIGVAAGGNFCMTGGYIESCLVGMYVAAGGNDGHGQITGVSFLHNTTQLQIQSGLGNGQFFGDCRFYEGDFQLPSAMTRAVTFSGCLFDLTTWTLQGKARFLNCSFDDGYTNTLTTAAGGELEFISPRALKLGIPAWIGNLFQQTYTFPSDANQTLANQVSWATELDIQAGVITAARTLTLGVRPPSKGQRIKVKNRTAYAVTIQWSTGTGVAVASGTTATIGADGTNAVDWSDSAVAATAFDPATQSLVMYQKDYAGSPWVGTASAGTSGGTGRSLTADTSPRTAPTVGANFGTHPSASFNGTTSSMTNGTLAFDSYMSASGYLISIDFLITSAAAPGGSAITDQILFGDNQGNFYIGVSTSGIRAGHYDGGYKTTPFLACSTGVKHNLQVWYDGTNITMRLDGGTATTPVAAAAMQSQTICYPRLGANYNFATFFNGLIGRAIMMNGPQTSTLRDQLLADSRTNYGTT